MKTIIRNIKKTVVWGILMLCISWVEVKAQAMEQDQFVSFSYLGHIGIQPGLRVGLEMPLIKPCPEKGVPKNNWVIRPQAAFFTNPRDDRHLLVNAEVGLKKARRGKNNYQLISFGLGWLNQSKLESFSVNLGNGQTDNEQRASDHFLLPTLNYEYGWATHRKVSWFSKLGLGHRLLGNKEESLMLFLEIGLKLKLKKN